MGPNVEPARKKTKLRTDHSVHKTDLVSLPENVLVNIFKYLDLKTIGICATLCSTLNNISKDSSLYKKITLKYNMSVEFLECFVSKTSFPKELFVEYKHTENDAEDYTTFDKYIRITLTKCGEHLETIRIENCRNDDILALLTDCTNLKRLSLYKCKGTFQYLSSISTLVNLKCTSCHFPQKIVSDIVRNNTGLEVLQLADNTNINVNEICEILSKSSYNMVDIFLSDRKELRAKSLRTLGRLTRLKSLVLVAGTDSGCDPEDSLEQIAAGCAKLEKLVIYGWKEINDENLTAVLHSCTQLREVDLRGLNITIRSCREAALSLPFLKTLDVIKCKRVKKIQLEKLQKDFPDIDIPLE